MLPFKSESALFALLIRSLFSKDDPFSKNVYYGPPRFQFLRIFTINYSQAGGIPVAGSLHVLRSTRVSQ